ncbi:MAG: aminotransferase class III-fold pyridoxal phosphate-dependent enzyme [Evtepia gabavorous]
MDNGLLRQLRARRPTRAMIKAGPQVQPSTSTARAAAPSSTLHNSFHGRTIATLAATGQGVFHQLFLPFNEGFRHAGANDSGRAWRPQAGDDVCAVMVELIQGEGGLRSHGRDFMVQRLADLCEQRDWLLLVDEVQTGIGRTGTLFAFQQFGIQPGCGPSPRGSPAWPALGRYPHQREVRRRSLKPWQPTAPPSGANPVSTASGPGGAGHPWTRRLLDRVTGEGGLPGGHPGTSRQPRQAMPGCRRAWASCSGVEVPGPGWTSRELAALLGRTTACWCLTAGARPAAAARPDHHEGARWTRAWPFWTGRPCMGHKR